MQRKETAFIYRDRAPAQSSHNMSKILKGHLNKHHSHTPLSGMLKHNLLQHLLIAHLQPRRPLVLMWSAGFIRSNSQVRGLSHDWLCVYRIRPVLRNQLKGPRAAECDEYFLANHYTTHESGVSCDRKLARLKSGIIAIGICWLIIILGTQESDKSCW